MLPALRSWSDRRCAKHVAEFARCFSERLGVPEYFIQLLILIEDKRFPNHRGLDPVGILRALSHNLRREGRRQGASTLAQQLYNLRRSKELSKPYSRSLGAKILQAAFGVWVTCLISKEMILAEYLKNVFWGKNFKGVDEAARGYLGKRRQDLSVEESFFLIERLCSPNRPSSRRVEVILRRECIVDVLNTNNSSIYALKRFYADAVGAIEYSALTPPKTRRSR